jgi:hypothetical protein
MHERCGYLKYLQLLVTENTINGKKFGWIFFLIQDKRVSKFKVCKSVHHCTIETSHQPDATTFQFIILTFIYSSICFGRFPAHHQELNDCNGSLWFYLRIVVIVVPCSCLGWPARPRTQHDYHHDTKVKPEAAIAVTELLMMGGKTPEACWAVNKCQDNKLKNCCIWLVTCLNRRVTKSMTDVSNIYTPVTYCLSKLFLHPCYILSLEAVLCQIESLIYAVCL